MPRSRHLKLTVHGEDVINDDFSDERWLSVEDTNKVGGERAFVASAIRHHYNTKPFTPMQPSTNLRTELPTYIPKP